MEDAATQGPTSPSTVPLTTYGKAVQERDEYTVAPTHLPALEQQMQETAKQPDGLQVPLLAVDHQATIAEAERDVALRSKGRKGMHKESEGTALSPPAVAGQGVGSPSAIAGICSDSAHLPVAGLLEYGSLVTKCLDRAHNCARQLKVVC